MSTENNTAVMEQEVLRLAYEESVKGVRRVPLDLVLALPSVKSQIYSANEIPDDLIRILVELQQDRYIVIHDLDMQRSLSGEWMVFNKANPAVSLTELGKQWMHSSGRAIDGIQIGGSSDSGQDGNRLSINPTAFSIPKDKEHSETGLLVAVMMPFKREFDSVYETIKSVCGKLGMTARKADDMWEDQTIIQDIFTLLYQADIVVVDFSGSNPNVMYETGIAHLLGREVVPLAQNIESDVPFDMRHHRVLQYVANKQGLEELAEKLLNKLQQYS